MPFYIKNKTIKFIFFIFLFLIFNGISKAENIVSLQFGANILIKNTYNTSKRIYKINPVGFSIGFLIPIHFSNIDVHYKVRAAFHSIDKYSGISQKKTACYSPPYDKFASGINEILVGKKINFKNDFEFLPQIGFGFLAETIYRTRDIGEVYDFFFIDVSLLLRYSFEKYGTGLMVNLENGFWESSDNYIANKRINVSFLFFK